jgi:UDP-N-acetylglucosamine 1-carboxyvinyltransferase
VYELAIKGGRPLKGTVRVSGSKNAVLPIICAALLAKSPSIIEDVPDLVDVRSICTLIEHLGAQVELEGGKLRITPPEKPDTAAPYQLVRRMRASFLVLGPMLARAGKAKISLPGGCAIGSRPIDLHLKGFSLLGADITYGYGTIEARARQLTGSRIHLDFPSVGATENILMAAVLAKGNTVIENAAEEPEIVDLANYLNSMGASVRGAGTKIIRVKGVDHLTGTTHKIIPDRIEAGTFLVAAACTGGEVLVENVIPEHLQPLLAKLGEAGVPIFEEQGGLKVHPVKQLRGIKVKTMPYPGFPTDMQPQVMSLLCLASGNSIITETVFENRFQHVSQLEKMGARIKLSGRSAIIEGDRPLHGAVVKASDLRAGAALVLAGLAARGESRVGRLNHIDRGYEQFEQKLRALGARITRKIRAEKMLHHGVHPGIYIGQGRRQEFPGEGKYQ